MAIPMNALAIAGLLLNAAVGVFGVEDDSLYAACPLIRAYYPPPTITKSSDGIAQLRTEFTEVFDKLIQDGGSEIYGPIMPNTTSFSVVLFSGAEPTKDDPIFFEYHYTSPRDQSATNDTITSDSKLPVGDLTMIFTVYAWLVEMGDNWETSITEYLPELGNTKGSAMIPWQDVTIGALAGHMLGLIRQCTLPLSHQHWHVLTEAQLVLVSLARVAIGKVAPFTRNRNIRDSKG